MASLEDLTSQSEQPVHRQMRALLPMLPQGLKEHWSRGRVLTFREAGFRFSPETARTRDKRVQGQHYKVHFQGLIFKQEIPCFPDDWRQAVI